MNFDGDGLSLILKYPPLIDVAKERLFQDQKWGTGRDFPDGVGDEEYCRLEQKYKLFNETNFRWHQINWAGIFLEEVYEAMAVQTDLHPDQLEKELIQVCAVAVNWIEAIRRRKVCHISTSQEEKT